MNGTDQTLPGDNTADTSEQGPVIIDDVDSFARHLVHWHQLQMTKLQHMLTIPEGTEVAFDGQEPIVLEGPVHEAFRIGITVALAEFGELPFSPIADDEADGPVQ